MKRRKTLQIPFRSEKQKQQSALNKAEDLKRSMMDSIQMDSYRIV